MKAGLFNGYWFARGGKKIRRATRAELAELYRLWAKHADIRTMRRVGFASSTSGLGNASRENAGERRS